MALVFVPALGGLIGKSGAPVDPERMRALSAGEEGDLRQVKGITGRYLQLLNVALRHPGKILLASLALLIVVQGAYVTFGRGVEFFPAVEPENVSLWVHGRGNLSIHERDALVREVEQEVLDLQAERGEFHSIYARSVASSGRENDEEPEDLVGIIQLEFVDWFARRPAQEILNEIRERSAHLAGTTIELREQEAGPPVGKPIQIQLSSSDPSLLEPTIDQILEVMDRVGGFVDLEEGRPVPGLEWEMQVDRAQAAKFGADVQLIGSYVQMATWGMEIGNYRPDTTEEEIDIVVRLPKEFRNSTHLQRIRVQTDRGNVPIANFVSLQPVPQTSLLRRVDGMRTMTIRSDVAPGLLPDDKVRELRQEIGSLDLNPAVRVSFRGEDEEQRAAADFLGKAFVIALFLMAIILVTQFNSFYNAALVLSAVVLSTIGVMLGLLITNQPFGIVMSGIGVIALAGIVVNNNIVLIDTFDRLKQEKMDLHEALLRTGAQRLRPVMLTTITTILGLMPMALGMNVDLLGRSVQFGAPSTQWWQQLAMAIAFGLAFATVLTLIVTPCALLARANLAAWLRRRFSRRSKRSDQPELPLDLPKAAE